MELNYGKLRVKEIKTKNEIENLTLHTTKSRGILRWLDEICIKTSESKHLDYKGFYSKYHYWFDSYFHKRNLIEE